MKYCLLILSLLLVGCVSSSMMVRVSDGRDDYSIYCDGKLACATSDNCIVKTMTNDDYVYLLVVRNGIIYGGVNVYREGNTSVSKSSLSGWDPPSPSGHGLQVLGDVLTNFPLYTLTYFALTPSNDYKVYGEFPKEIVLNVGPRDSSLVNYPWDQPIK
jgi:hypothetical protein